MKKILITGGAGFIGTNIIKKLIEKKIDIYVVDNKNFGRILYRQIAGALAKRIVNYAKVKDEAVQGADSGFIKFGSRVDLYLPLDSDIKVQLNQKVKGGETIIAERK